jgi:hypothetical protein
MNSILAYPAAGLNGYGALVDGGHNISSDKSCGFGAATSSNATDPKLAPLTAGSGPTATMPLLVGSPAIDHAAPVEGLTADQRGQPRPSGLGFDIGAYEAAYYSIQGKVTSGTAGIPGVKISLTSSNLTASMTTDGQGAFVFQRLLPDVYELNPPQAGVGFTPLFRTVHLDWLGTNAVRQDFSANPSRITDLQFEGGERLLTGVGVPHLTYWAQTTVDLVFWQTVATNTAEANGSLEFVDPQPVAEPQRYYRIESR